MPVLTLKLDSIILISCTLLLFSIIVSECFNRGPLKELASVFKRRLGKSLRCEDE